MSKKDDFSNAQKLGIGVGLTTAAVAAAGAYFLYGSKDAPENRKKVKSVVLKAKAEVLEALENAKEITEDEFHDLVDSVTKSYGQAKKMSKKDISDLKKEMKDNWEDLLSSGVAQIKTVSTVAKKVTKKPAKKTVKKAAKKTVKKTAKKTTKKK